MTTGMEQVIEAPKPIKRPFGLLLDVAPSLGLTGDRWRAGVKFTSYGTTGLDRAADQFCISGPTEDLDAGPGQGSGFPTTFESFTVFASESCSDLDVDLAWLGGRLDDRVAVMASEQVAYELEGGGNGVTNSLNTTATLLHTTAVPIGDALGELEEWLASVLHGAVGMIHMPPKALTNIDVRSVLTMVDGQWRTPTGHYVVADAGYTGHAPNSLDHSPISGNSYMYASSMVHVQMGPFSDLSEVPGDNLDRARNIFTGREVANAVFIFETDTVAAVEFTYPIDVD